MINRWRPVPYFPDIVLHAFFSIVLTFPDMSGARACCRSWPDCSLNGKMSPQDLMKSRSCKIQVYTFPITVKFERHLGSNAVFKIRFETCRTTAQFWQNLYMTKKESLPDRRKFCRSGSAVRHLFWRLAMLPKCLSNFRVIQWWSHGVETSQDLGVRHLTA